MTIEFRYLSQEEVIQLGGLDMALAIQDVEEVFRLFHAGKCILPSKVVLRWGDVESERMAHGHINAMPGYVGGGYDMAGIKWIAGMYSNPIEHRLPAISGLIILNHPILGLPVAAMDGTLISAMRTGAMGGVAAKYLARRDSRTVGVIGAGVQGRTLLMAVKTALPELSSVLVYDIRERPSKAFSQEMSDRLNMPVEIVAAAREAASRADILLSATTAVSPVVKRGWAPEGCLYCQMGGYECELVAVREFDKIVVDNWSEVQHRGIQVLALAKAQGILDDDAIYAELGEIVAGEKQARENRAERIFFSAVGMGILDIALATRILRRAQEQQVGTMLKLWETPVFV